jgi:hypothetical protein
MSDLIGFIVQGRDSDSRRWRALTEARPQGGIAVSANHAKARSILCDTLSGVNGSNSVFIRWVIQREEKAPGPATNMRLQKSHLTFSFPASADRYEHVTQPFDSPRDLATMRRPVQSR